MIRDYLCWLAFDWDSPRWLRRAHIHAAPWIFAFATRLAAACYEGAGMSIDRIVYEIRWSWWFYFGFRWPTWMYLGAYELDKDSRRIVLDRLRREWIAREPMYRGEYPHRVGTQE